jgi:hypothetical protein
MMGAIAPGDIFTSSPVNLEVCAEASFPLRIAIERESRRFWSVKGRRQHYESE